MTSSSSALLAGCWGCSSCHCLRFLFSLLNERVDLRDRRHSTPVSEVSRRELVFCVALNCRYKFIIGHISTHRASCHSAFGSRASATDFDSGGLGRLITSRFANSTNAHVVGVELATVCPAVHVCHALFIAGGIS